MTDTPAPTPEPGAETLSELYARDPFTLTRDDPAIHRMVETLRTQRVHFAAAGKPTPKAKEPKTKPEKITNLDQLDIGI